MVLFLHRLLDVLAVLAPFFHVPVAEPAFVLAPPPIALPLPPILHTLLIPLIPVLHLLPHSVLQTLLGPPPAPAACLSPLRSPSLPALAACLDTFTVPHDWYTAATYAAAQPDSGWMAGAEREAWVQTVRGLLDADDCSFVRIPPALASTYQVGAFRGHCVLYESRAPCGVYARGWGWMAVPVAKKRFRYSRSPDPVRNKLHIAAPHPGYDLGTPEQAAGVYEASGARSLLVAGRKRTAYLAESGCVRGTTGGKEAYWMTDPAHNDLEPFFDASITIYDWQRAPARGGCIPGSCALLQLHGKGAATCPGDEVFVSGGLANTTAPPAFYTAPHPAALLAGALKDVFPSYAIALPTTSKCVLTASKNVVGRYVNGVSRGEVCTNAAERNGCGDNEGLGDDRCRGVWVHAEQSRGARGEAAYDGWARAVRMMVDKSDGQDTTQAEKGVVIADRARAHEVAMDPQGRMGKADALPGGRTWALVGKWDVAMQ